MYIFVEYLDGHACLYTRNKKVKINKVYICIYNEFCLLKNLIYKNILYRNFIFLHFIIYEYSDILY